MKPRNADVPTPLPWSLPARERGLKLDEKGCKKVLQEVAPRAGAWIETIEQQSLSGDEVVAPRAGAWIETVCLRRSPVGLRRSLPARERGLKQI